MYCLGCVGLAMLRGGVVKGEFLNDVDQGLGVAISEEAPGLLPGAPASPGDRMPDIS